MICYNLNIIIANNDTSWNPKAILMKKIYSTNLMEVAKMSELIMSKYYFEKDFKEFETYIKKFRMVKKHYHQKQIISSQGETLKNGYYIQSGIMQLKIGNELGKEKTLAFFGPGSIFPLGVNEHHYAMEYAMTEIAFTDVIACEFNFTELRRMVMENSDLSLKMLEHYCDFVSFLFYEIASQSYDSTLIRIANIIYIFAIKIYHSHVIGLSQDDIAEIAGVSKIQVARAYKYLREQGIIDSFRNGLKIADVQALQTLCSSDIISE